MARVVVDVAGNVIESVITRQSAEDLGLKEGDAVTAAIKSTEVMIQMGRSPVACIPRSGGTAGRLLSAAQ